MADRTATPPLGGGKTGARVTGYVGQWLISRPDVRLLAGFAAAYLIGAWLAGKIAIVPSIGVTLWLPGGLFIATLLLTERTTWIWWVLAGMAAELSANALFFHNPIPAALAIFAGNALEALIGAALVLRWCKPPIRLNGIGEVAALTIFGILLAPMVSATIGSLTLAAIGKSFAESWPVWWMGDSAGISILAPSLLLAVQLPHALQNLSAARWIEASVLIVTFAIIVHLSISGFFPFIYLTTPLLLLASLRFELRGAVLAILLLSVITGFHTVNGTSQFLLKSASAREALLWTEIFLAVSALLALVVASLAQQHKQALAKITNVNRELEALVNERTMRLGESEDRLRQALAAGKAGTWETDIDSGEFMASDAALALHGLPPRTPMTSDKALLAVHPDDQEIVRAALRRCREEESPFRIEVRIPQADGSTRWVLSQADLRKAGTSRRLVGLVQDITDLKIAQEERNASELRLQTAVEAADLGTWELDLVTDRSLVRSLRHDQMFGYSGPQAEWGQAIAERHVLEEDRPVFREAFKRALVTGQLEFEVRVRWPDGSIHWIAPLGRVFYGADGKPVRMAGVVADVTGRKHAAELKRRSSEVYYRLIQDNPFGIYLVDADFRLAQVSEGARKVFATVNPLLGRDFAEILKIIWTEPFASEAIARFRHTLATGEPYHAPDTTKQRADIGETESYDWKIERVLLPDGRFGVVCYFYDMTERQRHEEHVRMLMREVSHRSKNMLVLVHSIARQTAAQDGPSFIVEFEQRILALSASHNLLVNSGWRGVALDALIQSQLAHFKTLLGTRIKIEGPDLTLDPAAAQTIGMAIYELATNAGKYGALSDRKGKVAISWDTKAGSAGDKRFSMSWIETSGPKVKKPRRRGFGTTVVDRMCRMTLDADVSLDYADKGFSWTLACPMSRLTEGAGAAAVKLDKLH